MSHDHNLSRLYSPWETFTHQDEKKHNAKNVLAFRLDRSPPKFGSASRLPISPRSTSEVIDLFLNYGSKGLDGHIPRERQLLKDSLKASDEPLS
jgi:hypothetical protein